VYALAGRSAAIRTIDEVVGAASAAPQVAGAAYGRSRRPSCSCWFRAAPAPVTRNAADVEALDSCLTVVAI